MLSKVHTSNANLIETWLCYEYITKAYSLVHLSQCLSLIASSIESGLTYCTPPSKYYRSIGGLHESCFDTPRKTGTTAREELSRPLPITPKSSMSGDVADNISFYNLDGEKHRAVRATPELGCLLCREMLGVGKRHSFEHQPCGDALRLLTRACMEPLRT